MSGGRRGGPPPRRSGPRDRDPAPVRDQVVCQLERKGRLLMAQPFFERGRGIPVDKVRDARPGDLVLLQTSRATRGRPKVLRVLGTPDNASAVIEALMLDRGLSRRFGAGIERAAAEARDGGGTTGFQGAARRDLRDLTTFTIDPATAKDFDDAISAEELDGADHWRVWVHIADVSAFVRPGDQVDREAYRRGTSVYVPGKVEPMLPEALSNDACSLKPGVDRLAVTVEMEIRGQDVAAAEFYRSTIRSDERLDYERVDRIFASQEQAHAPWAVPLATARAAAAALGERRQQEGALAIESSEQDFEFDRKGHVVGSHDSLQTESHRLIEYLMVAANEQVAKLLAGRGIPTLFRVHERPTAEAVQRLSLQLASLDVATPPVPDHLSPSEAAELITEMSQLIDQHVKRTGRGRKALTSLLLRSLKQARYEPRNLGHAGLGLTHYCHFTSPIRRYPDLICHRALLSAVGGGEDAPPAGAMDEAGTTTSARERDAMVIERKADDVARCFLLERELFAEAKKQPRHELQREFDGEVIGLIGAGAFVAFGDGYEGMLPVRRMRGDWWELNEEGTILFGAESGKTIRLGDPVSVLVGRIDAPHGRVDLDLKGVVLNAMAKGGKRKIDAGDVATNRQAAYRFEFLDKLECGMVLTGTEVKSVRNGGVQIKDGFAMIRDGELWLHNVHIAPYAPAHQFNHEPERSRKLLAKRAEIDRLAAQTKEKGLTLVPTRIYFRGTRAKVEIALGKGKDRFDKRDTIKKRETERDMQRELREANR